MIRILFIFALLIQNSLFAASFDCSNVNSEMEIRICNDNLISEKDAEMGLLYSNFFISKYNLGITSDGLSYIILSQRKWIKIRDNCLKSDNINSCISEEYSKRILELEVINTYKERGYGDTSKLKQMEISCDRQEYMSMIRSCAYEIKIYLLNALKVDIDFLKNGFGLTIQNQKQWENSVTEVCEYLTNSDPNASIGDLESDGCYIEAYRARRSQLSWLLLIRSR
jgi:uncharacterized protein